MTASAPVLRPGRTKSLDELWGRVDPDDAAVRVADQLASAARTLPLTVFVGARVYPIVSWNAEALRARTWNLQGPIVAPSDVRDQMDAIPSVLSIVGFIGVGPERKMRRELAGLRSVGRTIGMMPNRPGSTPLEREEFDAQGSALVVVDEERVSVEVGGDGAMKFGSDLAGVWRRTFEERLFWWALRCNLLPDP